MIILARLRRYFCFSICIVVALSLGVAASAQVDDRQDYELGTATTSGLAHAVGVTLAALVKLKLLPYANIDVNARNTSGSKDNAALLRDGQIDFGILNSLDVDWTSDEAEQSQEGETGADIRMLSNLWQEAFHVLVRKDLAQTGGFADLFDLEISRIGIEIREKEGIAHGLALLQALGLADDSQISSLKLEDALIAFSRGDLDAFVFNTEASSNLDLAAFLDDAKGVAELIGVSDSEIALANRQGSKAWSSVEVPFVAGVDQGVKKRSFAINYFLGSSTSVDEEAVYLITKTIFDNLPILQGMHQATEGIGVQNALDGIILPVHVGAERYYSEIGVEIPEPDVPRVSNLADNDFLTRYSTIEEARLLLANHNLSILGGQNGQTIGQFTSELASNLETETLRILGMTSPDPANNIAQVLYAKGIDSALVPLDVLDYALEKDIYPGLQSKLMYTTELFTQEFHLIARDDIETIEDLIDQPVNLGTRHSGSEFTASFLLDTLDIPVQPSYLDASRALALLEKGDIVAMVVVAGKPAPLIEGLQEKSGLHLLSVPALEGNAYRPATISADDYPGLLAAGATAETFSVRTMLMTYNWRRDNPRYAVISSFVASFFDKLSRLTEEDVHLHPKWHEINPYSELEGWRRFPAAQNWLNSGQLPARAQWRTDSEG